MGDNYNGPAKHVTTIKDVLEATSSDRVRKWKTRELDYLYDVASGMLLGAEGGDLRQLQNSLREIVSRKSDLEGRKWKWVAALSTVAALGTFGLRLADQAKIQSLESRIGHLETTTHVHTLIPAPLSGTSTPTTDPSMDTSSRPKTSTSHPE